MQWSRAERDRKAYRIVEQMPSESSEDDASGSDDEWLPGKEGVANASSSDSEAEDDEGAMDAENEGVEEDVPINRGRVEKAENQSGLTWKIKDSQSEGDLPPFLGEWKMEC